ncbi:unnamed protein product [Rotaria magnacalcarata]|uniref:Uncharacterized protein n=1 Tax=Rotaria magnacalcarata TaxID=392030 RepID=A0A816W057_9BILA|nr:unnamed protein product [Rotaria magnacalcarata]
MSEYINNCFCCGHYLVPRYKRLVNNIFPQNPLHGLDRNNLERLRFYAVRRPEKLDKAFRYLCEKISRYLNNRNRPYVILGITVMNDIVKSCYQLLNTFVDDYLETLRLVLEERDDLELIEQAVASFESFCEIREEAPNYQRNYQFFVHRFTALCYYHDEMNKIKLRCLGLRGHHALFRKTANDELQNDAWKHMDQIMPSIIFNMEVEEKNQSQEATTTIVSPENVTIKNEQMTNEETSTLADILFRDIFNRAHSNTNISICVELILVHLDKNAKWIPGDFSKYIFSRIMNSIRHHNSYVVTDLLLNHLDDHLNIRDRTDIRTSIMNVIHDCLVFSAPNTGAGTTIFTGILNLLNFLKKSFRIELQRSKGSPKYPDEHKFQAAVISGIEDFAENLPDFQMMEIIQCIASSLSTLYQNTEEHTSDSNFSNFRLQLLLLKTMQKIILKKHARQTPASNSHEITIQHQSEKSSETISILTTFPHQLFDPLIKLISSPELELRLLALEILQLLVDRRHYADRLLKIRIFQDISQLGLPTDTKRSRLSDIPFMKKFGHQFRSQLYKCILFENNTRKIFYAIYCLMNIVTLEADDPDVLVDAIHFCFEIQSGIIKMMDDDQRKLPKTNYHGIHALIAAYFNLMSKVYDINQFSGHVDESFLLSALNIIFSSAIDSTVTTNLLNFKNGINDFLPFYLLMILKIRSEAVCESAASILKRHIPNNRSLQHECLDNEAMLHWNAPPIHLADSFIEHSLDDYFKTKKDKNWFFYMKSEQYQTWKLLGPGSVVINRFRNEQVPRLPELIDD